MWLHYSWKIYHWTITSAYAGKIPQIWQTSLCCFWHYIFWWRHFVNSTQNLRCRQILNSAHKLPNYQQGQETISQVCCNKGAFWLIISMQAVIMQSILRAWCKNIVTTLFHITSYNSFVPSPRYHDIIFINIITISINY